MLAIAFGSLVAMSLPIVVALVGLLIGTSAIGVMSGAIPVPTIASVVGIMIGLGVGIDYALFILARHRQNLETGMPVPEAIGRANATAGLSVLFAGATVVLAIAGLYVSGIPMMATMGWASAIMVAVSMVAAVTLLPALLGITKRRVNSVKVPFVKRRPAWDPNSTSVRWTARVVKSPVRYGAAAALVLVVLAIPVLSMRLGFADSGNDAPVTTTRKAYDLIADHYGPGKNGPLAGRRRHGRHQRRREGDRDGARHRDRHRRRGRLRRRPGARREGRPGDHRGHPDHRAAGRGHLDPAGAPARQT